LRYCVFGDIHGNLEALEAVLADAEKQGSERYLCVGDVVGYGADPHKCIARVRELTSQVVAGNHDCAVVGRAGVEYFNLYAREAILWTGGQLSPDEKAFLWGLPLSLVVNGLTVVHATVHEPEGFGYIDNDLMARLSFEALQTEIGFVGHSHVPVTFFYEEHGDEIWYSQDAEIPLGGFTKTIVNVGSVGQPRDDNPQAAYALLDTERRAVSIRRVPYDIEAARQKILAAGLPEILAARLLLGR
jgi:diadenosine tetraphosphatase ApaH/serine/threonine PP2A family protein phosphatase